MLAEGEDIGGEAIFQFNLGQGLAFAHVQAAQRLPARPEIELALLPSAVVGVKDNLPIAATRGNGGAIDRGCRRSWHGAMVPVECSTHSLPCEKPRSGMSLSRHLHRARAGAGLAPLRFGTRKHIGARKKTSWNSTAP